MKKFFVFLLGFLVLGVIIYRQDIGKLLSYSQCDTPQTYKIGSIDQKFGLTRSQILTNIQTATNILSTAKNKQLFAYSPNAQLTVNFVYDKRAALDTQIINLRNQLDQKNTTLQQQINDYETAVALFEQKLAAINATIEEYNKQGGAPPDVYKSLTEQQNQLETEGETLNQRARQLNLSTRNYNLGVSDLNLSVSQFNYAIILKPEEGLYNEADNTITIYFASNYNELIHTLAHEFGHALGMQHVKDSGAIMFPYSTTSLTFTQQDIEQLTYACQKQPLPLHAITVFEKWFSTSTWPLIDVFKKSPTIH